MNSFRNQLFPGAAFTGNENRAVCYADDLDHLEELLHFFALPDEIAHPVYFFELALQIGVFFTQAAGLKSLMNDELQLLHEIFSLQDVVECAHFQCLDGASATGATTQASNLFVETVGPQ